MFCSLVKRSVSCIRHFFLFPGRENDDGALSLLFHDDGEQTFLTSFFVLLCHFSLITFLKAAYFTWVLRSSPAMCPLDFRLIAGKRGDFDNVSKELGLKIAIYFE